MFLGFRQIMHDSFPDQILGQWLPPAPLLRLRLFRLILFLLSGRLGVFFFRRARSSTGSRTTPVVL